MFELPNNNTSVNEELFKKLVKSQPRKARTIKAHAQRMARMQRLIKERFGITHPQQWRAKHLRWLMKDGLGDISPVTAYDYWRTCKLIMEVRNIYEDWEPHLRGPWRNPEGELRPAGRGGRPALKL